jgi:hypothetical protein
MDFTWLSYSLVKSFYLRLVLVFKMDHSQFKSR